MPGDERRSPIERIVDWGVRKQYQFESMSRREYMMYAGLGALTATPLAGLWADRNDPFGNLVVEDIPHDIDYDGLFEDLNENREVGLSDAAVHATERTEDIITEMFPHAFDAGEYFSNSGRQPEGSPRPINIHYQSSFDKGEQISNQLESVLNNSARRLDNDWFPDISTYEYGEELEEVRNAPEEFIEDEDLESEVFEIFLFEDGELEAVNVEDYNAAIATGLEDISKRDGVPLLTKSYAEIKPVEALGYAVGMDSDGGSESTVTYGSADTISGDGVEVFHPMSSVDISEASSEGDLHQFYTPLFSQKSLESSYLDGQ